MLNKTLLLLIGLSVSSAALAEDRASKQENIGVSVGAVVGAAAGGPVGFFVGAVSGALLGERMHKREQQVENLSAALDARSDEMLSLEQEIADHERTMAELDDRLAEISAEPGQKALALLESGFDLDIPFRTESAATEQELVERLYTFSESLSEIPGVVVELHGYADPRGAIAYNQKLSLERAESIRALFLDAGMRSEQIEVTAHGARGQLRTDMNQDELAFERRVHVRIRLEDPDSPRQLAGL